MWIQDPGSRILHAGSTGSRILDPGSQILDLGFQNSGSSASIWNPWIRNLGSSIPEADSYNTTKSTCFYNENGLNAPALGKIPRPNGYPSISKFSPPPSNPTLPSFPSSRTCQSYPSFHSCCSVLEDPSSWLKYTYHAAHAYRCVEQGGRSNS